MIAVITARLNYNADASSRQSGSAVHDVNGTVHAIHTAGAGTSNTGIKINAVIFNLSWIIHGDVFHMEFVTIKIQNLYQRGDSIGCGYNYLL